MIQNREIRDEASETTQQYSQKNCQDIVYLIVELEEDDPLSMTVSNAYVSSLYL